MAARYQKSSFKFFYYFDQKRKIQQNKKIDFLRVGRFRSLLSGDGGAAGGGGGGPFLGLGVILGLGGDVGDFDAFLAVVLRAAVGELGLGVELVLEEFAAGSLLQVDQRAAVAHLFSQTDLLVLWRSRRSRYRTQESRLG